MTNIIYYITNNDNLYKNICSLGEKCYTCKQNTIIITNNDHETKIIDNILWTYSRNFLPHATNKDFFPEKQPLYISSEIENPNKANILILINPNYTNLIKTFQNKEFFKNLFKICIILDDTAILPQHKITNIMINYKLIISSSLTFVYQKNGLWKKENNFLSTG